MFVLVKRLLSVSLCACLLTALVSCSDSGPAIPVGGGEVGNTSVFQGTWKSTVEIMFQPIGTADYFYDYVYMSFTEDSLVIYVPSRGSTFSLQYSLSDQGNGSYIMTATENGVDSMIYITALNNTFTFSGLNTISVADGIVGSANMVKISNGIEFQPGMPPEESEEPGGGGEEGGNPGEEVTLAGRWEAEPAIPGMVEYYWFEFNEDGSMQYGEKGTSEIIGDKIYDGTYSVDGNRITIKLPSYPMPNLQNATSTFEITSEGKFWFPDKNDGLWGSNQLFGQFSKVESSNPDEPGTGEEEDKPEFTVDGDTITGYNGTDTEIVIPSSIGGVTITKIADSAFEDNKNITSVLIPASITYVGDNAFRGCSNLKDVVLEPSSDRDLGSSCFAETGIEEIVIPLETFLPGNWNYVNAGAFQNCKDLVSVTIEGTERYKYYYIHRDSFSGCTSLKHVDLPEVLTEINSGAFEGCTSLETIELPAGLEAIDEGAFLNSGLTSVEIPASVTDIAGNAFNNIPGGNVTVDSANRSFAIGEGGHIVKKGSRTEMVAYVGDTSGTVTIPDGYTALNGVFEGSDEIEGVIIPASVERISATFRACSNLSSVEFEEGSKLKKIGDYTFAYCDSLKKIWLPEGMTSSGYNAFQGVTLTELGYPSTVTSAHFMQMNGMTIYFYGTKEQWNALEPGESRPYTNYTNKVIFQGDAE